MQDKEDGRGSAAKPGKFSKAGSKKAAGAAEDTKAGKAADRQRQAQLEMLMMDDNALQDMSRIGSAATWQLAQSWCLLMLTLLAAPVVSVVHLCKVGHMSGIQGVSQMIESNSSCLLQAVLFEYASTFFENFTSRA